MREVWLKQNTRAILFGTVPPALLVLLAALWLGWWGASAGAWARGLAWLIVALGVVALANLGFQLRQPRIAYQGGRLLLNLRGGPPLQVPIDVVEAFLLGVGPAMLSGDDADTRETRVLNIRLAERAEEWAHREVKPALGKWCGGYITIRGTWCEPLNVTLVNRLNQRLAEVQKQVHEQHSKDVA